MAKILVVDDNDLVRSATRTLLESAGHEVDETGDSASVVGYVESSPPDLVLTDLVMPDPKGVDIIRALRRAGYRGAIIAMSGGGGAGGPTDLLNTARELGADDCVSKPFHRAELCAKVTAILERPVGT
jgi:DNA-binding response OmpR family regulator